MGRALFTLLQTVEETDGQMALQVVSAGKQGQALVCGIMEQVCSPENLRSAHGQVKQNKTYNLNRHTDLKNFFDAVNHDRLMYRLSTRTGDKPLLKLIRKSL
ncbi:MAG: hypothetical protein LBG45_03240, partial [Dysgonamonadaceae bacterium]|nr:hypothetical protein [Dysgonamonadaceae bacterium]